MAIHLVLKSLAEGAAVPAQTLEAALEQVLSGEATPVQCAALLMGLRVRGETQSDIQAGVAVLRRTMGRVRAPLGAIDVCGTGGDGHGTFNVSTAVAIVAAACGVNVAKHGNRAVSSQSGSSDVLGALGLNLDLTTEQHEACLAAVGISFLPAPMFHPAMARVAPVRRELGLRTLFNLLGPLSNPAGTTRQLVGVFSPTWMEPVARTLQALGGERAWVVHGADGLDELSTTGVNEVVAFDGAGPLQYLSIDAQDYGLARAALADLKGGDAAHNAAAMKAIFAGARGPYADIVALNAGAALVIAGKCQDLKAGIALAQSALHSGAAGEKLAAWVRFTQEHVA
jgi:anthranilate phosphoribosyltransferase